MIITYDTEYNAWTLKEEPIEPMPGHAHTRVPSVACSVNCDYKDYKDGLGHFLPISSK